MVKYMEIGHVFRAYDIRGIYPKEIDEGFALKLGKAFGTFNPGTIVVGMDVRTSSPQLKEALINGLLTTGVTIVDIGTVTTPMVIFATAYYKYDGGVMITASHNPKEYNGMLTYGKKGVPISFEAGMNKVKEILESGKFPKGNGKYITKNIIDDYTNFLFSKLKIENPPKLKIVVDAGNGSAGLVYPEILRKLGIEVIELYCEPDGNFPNRNPEPKKENLTELKNKVLETKADFGLAYDADGDRLAVVDEEGTILESREVFGTLIINELEKNPNSKVVHEVLTSKMIEELIKSYNGLPILCRVGHTFIPLKMIEHNATLGGEISGHYFFKEIFAADDALFASMKIIEYLTKTRKKLSECYKFFRTYPMEDLRVPIKESEKFPFIEKLKEEFKDRNYQMDFTDGVKVVFEDSWALLRPSNTEPKISIAYEGITQEGFERVKSFVTDIVKTIPK